MHDELGSRMKDQYESRTKYFLPRRTYTIIRLDGKAFHTFTRGCQKPFDKSIMNMMDATTLELCKQIQGVKLAYTQSDEISLLLADFDTIRTNSWFDSSIQKICSVSASIATAEFNKQVAILALEQEVPRACATGTDSVRTAIHILQSTNLANFDARAFTIPDPVEVENYFIWRQQDASRNSIQMAAQALFSHKELQGKNVNELQELMFQKHGINWNDYSVREKRGATVVKVAEGWRVDNPPIFTKDRKYLQSYIPLFDFLKRKEEPADGTQI